VTYRVLISSRARRDLSQISRWWAENRDATQASQWYDGMLAALRSLNENPAGHPLAHEDERFPYELHELHFGLSSRATHRALFTIESDCVVILAIRHAAQREVTPGDISR